MKLLNVLVLSVSVSAMVVEPRHRNQNGNNNVANTVARAVKSDIVARQANVLARHRKRDGDDGQTQVLKEIGGIPGNECLTFRNNGEIVDAACVNEAADRQMTPTTLNGESVLQVQRSFSADFRADLVGVDACVGFNGTHFRAEDCAASGIEKVTFQGGELRATSGACSSGHDDAAQMTVDASGESCAQYTSTEVTPTES